MTIFFAYFALLRHTNMPGFKINPSAFCMCRICIQLGFRQILPQKQIPIKGKRNDGKVIIIIHGKQSNGNVDMYTYQLSPF